MVPAWLSALGIFVVFVGFLGAAAVFLRGSKDKGTIEVLERSNNALAGRVDILEKENGELKQENGALKVRVTALEQERPSAEVLLEIRKELTAYVADARNNNAETRALLMAIAKIIEPRDET